MVPGIVGRVFASRKQAALKRRNAKAAAANARKEEEEELPEDELLGDEELLRSTSVASVDRRMLKVARHRHDVCVFLRQKRATDLYHNEVSKLRGRALKKKPTDQYSMESSQTPRSRVRFEDEESGSLPKVEDFPNDSANEDEADAPMRVHLRNLVGGLVSMRPWIETSITGGVASSGDRTHDGEYQRMPKPSTQCFASGNWQLTHKVEDNELERWALCTCLSRENWFRRFCINLATSERFDQVILLLIFIGSLLMCWDTPGAQQEHPTRDRIIKICEELLLYTFTFEVAIKIVARGLWRGRRTYLRDHWNKLDVLVVCGGWASMLTNQIGSCLSWGLLFCAHPVSTNGTLPGLNALRTIRILRPLRAIKQYPGMKALVNCLFKSLPELLDSLILCGFVLLLFGIVGVQLFMGDFQQRCVPEGVPYSALNKSLDLCMIDGALQCAEGFVCEASTGINPNNGITSFDNLPLAMLAVFQSITLEGWVDIMYDVRKVKGIAHDMYFVALVLFGSLFMTNLVVGTLVARFMDISAEEQITLQETLSLSAQSSVKEVGKNLQSNGQQPSRAPASISTYLDDTDPSYWCQLRRCCFRLCKSAVASSVVMTLIILNTVVLALDDVLSDFIHDILNIIFTGIFFVEMLIKLIGLGPKLYCTDHFNIFDAVIVSVSIVEIALQEALSIKGPSTTVLRTFRLLRVFKLARSLPGLRKILDALLLSLSSIVDLGWLLLLFMFVCALMGMAFFGCVQEDYGKPDAKWAFQDTEMYHGKLARPNFSSFLYSMTTVFVIITGENWNEVMYVGVTKNGWASAIYFVFIMIVGNYIVLNLFLAVLIEKFDKADGEAGIVSEDNFADGHDMTARLPEADHRASNGLEYTKGILGIIYRFRYGRRESPRGSDIDDGRVVALPSVDDEATERVVTDPDAVAPRHRPQQLNISSDVAHSEGAEDELWRHPESFPPSARSDRSESHSVRISEGSSTSPVRPKRRISRTRTSKDIVAVSGFAGSSLFIFGPGNRFRLFVWTLIRHPYFDSFIYGLIAVSALLLALDAPIVQDVETKHVFKVMDYMLTCIFLVEAALKIIVLGFILGEHSYLRDSWNILDFFVLVSSIANIFMHENGWGQDLGAALAWVKGLRALRALRPLRMVSRNEGMKAVVDAIFLSVPAIADVMLVLVLFLFTFSILGVQLLKDKFWRCSCQDYCPEKIFNPVGKLAEGQPAEHLCQGICPGAPAHLSTCHWERHSDWSFDNVAWATLTLFEVATLEQWPDVMWLAVDGSSYDSGPQYNNSPYVVLFFITYLFIMSFFILNLFVGVVIDKFTDVRNAMNGQKTLSDEQKQWVAVQRLLLRARPRPLIMTFESKWRQLALQLVSLRSFECCIMGLIIANIAVMCTSFHGASDGVVRIQECSNSVFLSIFTAEAALKMFALHPKMYFIDKWNCFDFMIVCGSIISSMIDRWGGDQVVDATVLRVFRIARIFRLVKSLESLRKKFLTLVLSLPSLVNVGAMLFLLFFVYAVAGMDLFGDIMIEGNPYLRQMNQDANFGSFYLAFMMLLRMSTGEAWNGIMHDCFTGALCHESGKPECGNTFLAIVFFVSFMIIGSFVFLNLFIAVIIEQIFECDGSTDNEVTVSETEIDQFIDAWSRFAPEGNDFIPTVQLSDLLRQIDPPLGFSGEVIMNGRILRLMKCLGFRDHGGRVHFAETLWRLASMVVGADMREVAHFELLRNLDKRVIRALPPPWSSRHGEHVVYLAAEVAASVKVQSRWRARQTQRTFMRIVQGHIASGKIQEGSKLLRALEGAIEAAEIPSSKIVKTEPNISKFAAKWKASIRKRPAAEPISALSGQVLTNESPASPASSCPEFPSVQTAAVPSAVNCRRLVAEWDVDPSPPIADESQSILADNATFNKQHLLVKATPIQQSQHGATSFNAAAEDSTSDPSDGGVISGLITSCGSGDATASCCSASSISVVVPTTREQMGGAARASQSPRVVVMQHSCAERMAPCLSGGNKSIEAEKSSTIIVSQSELRRTRPGAPKVSASIDL